MNAVALFLWCTTSLVPQQQDGKHALQLQEAFALLDQFDTLDTRTLPFVRVATGRGDQWLGQPGSNRYRYGFLLGSDRTSFRVRYLELDRDELTPTPPGTAEYARVGFELVDLQSFAPTLADQLLVDESSMFTMLMRETEYTQRDTPLHRKTVVLLLARACARAGLAAHAELLWTRLCNAHGIDFELRWDLATHLILTHADPAVSWDELLARHDAWLRAYGTSKTEERVRERRDAVQAMLAHRAKRAPRSDPPSDADLIEDLRDCLLPTDSGGFDEWSIESRLPWPQHARRAYDTLVARGLDAVPALIDVLGDPSPTRSVSYCSRYGGSFQVRSLGDVARDVLVAIAGEQAKDWNAWLEAAKARGLRDMVLRALAAGSPAAARAWLARWPDDVAPLIDATRKPDSATRLLVMRAALDAAASSSRPPLLQALRELAKADPDTRVDAWALLLRYGDTTGCRELVDDLQQGRATFATLSADLDGVEPGRYSPAEHAVETLLRSGSAGAWTWLQQQANDPAMRRAIVAALSCLCREDLLAHVSRDDAEAFGRAARGCLLRLLADDTRHGPAPVVIGRRRIDLHNASTADVAACTLSSLWPDEFPFDAARSASTRARQIDAMRRPDERRPPSAQDALRPPNFVACVAIDESAAGVDTATRDAVQGLRGKEVDGHQLRDTMAALARCRAAAGKRVVLDVERTGEGDGMRVRVELATPPENRPDLTLVCTVGGTNTARGSTNSIQEVDVSALQAMAAALAAGAATPVEITLSLAR